jgi:energy-coupling factor transporter ATP-binding protein EcfA2
VLELKSVTYRYPGYARLVLSELDLTLRDGEIVGLVGPNEAGKSTLCLVASGLAPASIGGTLTGELVIDSTPAAGLRPYELASRVGLVFQNPNTQRSGVSATVFEEVALGPVNLGLPVTETVERTRWAMAAVHITDLLERDPARLSGGEAQLVAIASILAMRPRHLVLDEPTAQLDPEGTRLVAEALRDLAATGTALLIAEHKTDVLSEICHRLIAIDGGRIVLDAAAPGAFEHPVLDEIGVERPASVRIRTTLATAGVEMPGGSLA